MIRRIAYTASMNRSLVVLLLLSGVLVITVAVQASRFAAGAGAQPDLSHGPWVPKITSGPADPTEETGATFVFSAKGAVSYRCSTDVSPEPVVCSSPRTYPSGTFAAGAHAFRVRAVSGAGVSEATSYEWTVDTASPPPPKTPAGTGTPGSTPAGPVGSPGSTPTPPSPSVPTTGPGGAATPGVTPSPSPSVPTITAGPADPTSETGATFVFGTNGAASYLCSTDADPAFVLCSSPATYAEGTFAAGVHTFLVKAVSGAATSRAAAYSWTVDLTPPPPPTFEQVPADPNPNASANFAISDAENGVAYACSLDAAPYQSCGTSVTVENLSPGTHTFCVEAIDHAGNRSTPTCHTWQQGSGTGSGGSSGGGGGGGTVGVPYTMSGSVGTPLRPGGAAAAIDVGFSSTNAGNGGTGVDGVRVSSLVVGIVSVTGGSNVPNVCTAADFAVTQFTGAYPFYVPLGASSLSSLRFAPGSWPKIRMKETGQNQNGCKGATLHLSFTGAS